MEMSKLEARKKLILNLFYLMYFIIFTMTFFGLSPFWHNKLPMMIYAAVMLILIGIMHRRAAEKMDKADEGETDEKAESVDSIE